MENEIKFTACGFFKLDFPLLQSVSREDIVSTLFERWRPNKDIICFQIAAAVSTYLIVSISFWEEWYLPFYKEDLVFTYLLRGTI